MYEPQVNKARKAEDGPKTHGVEAMFAFKRDTNLAVAQPWKDRPARERREPIFKRRPPPRRKDGKYVYMYICMCVSRAYLCVCRVCI